MTYYNSTDTCDKIKEHGKRCGKDIRMRAYKEKDKDGLWTGSWMCRKCYELLSSYGTVDVENIRLTKEKNWYEAIGKQYGKEFADWAKQNNKVPDSWINAGCKTAREYQNKCAIDAGFKNISERDREWRYKTGRSGLIREINEDCESWFGDYVENHMIRLYPGAQKMPPGNIGYDWIWKGIKIDSKGRCLDWGCKWTFPIFWNNVADKFTLSGWDTRENLNLMYAWEFDKNDLVKMGQGNNPPKVKFWKREYIVIPSTPEGLNEFKDYQVGEELLKTIRNEEL